MSMRSYINYINIFLGRLRAICHSRKNIRIGRKTEFDNNVTIHLSGKEGGYVKIGNHCSIKRGSILITENGNITIGDNCTINPYCILYGNGGLSIGNNVRIATHTVIVPANHNFHNIDIPICKQGLTTKGIKIDNDVWIGAHCSILDGVHIAEGCIIGAGSVLTKSTEPYGIYVGNPARFLRKRYE